MALRKIPRGFNVLAQLNAETAQMERNVKSYPSYRAAAALPDTGG